MVDRDPCNSVRGAVLARLHMSDSGGFSHVPHFIVEYTDNIKEDADIPGLLRKLHTTMLAQDGVFPLGGIRLRAHELKHYFVADGSPENAFVHAVLKIGQGRSPEVKAKVCQELFATMKAHFFSPGKED